MSTLASTQLQELSQRIAVRKEQLLEEVRQGLSRSGHQRHADLWGETGDASDASVAALLRDVAEAEVRRDVLELRDIVAAQGRIAAGHYGTCVDCGAAVSHRRLTAYPTAKRCLGCQQSRERSGRYGPQPSL
jgi:RNA polymerase-binding transcription factor DksA